MMHLAFLSCQLTVVTQDIVLVIARVSDVLERTRLGRLSASTSKIGRGGPSQFDSPPQPSFQLIFHTSRSSINVTFSVRTKLDDDTKNVLR